MMGKDLQHGAASPVARLFNSATVPAAQLTSKKGMKSVTHRLDEYTPLTTPRFHRQTTASSIADFRRALQGDSKDRCGCKVFLGHGANRLLHARFHSRYRGPCGRESYPHCDGIGLPGRRGNADLNGGA